MTTVGMLCLQHLHNVHDYLVHIFEKFHAIDGTNDSYVLPPVRGERVRKIDKEQQYIDRLYKEKKN